MRTLLLHDPVIRRLASNGKVKSAATRGPCLSCLGSAPQAGVFSGFQYLTVPLITESRIRSAIDRVARHQFDGAGRRVFHDITGLLADEQARVRVGQVAVPFGICTEPSNVKAGGSACPYRYVCAGCGHFRSDPSYLPELKSYLQQLLADSERLHAAADLQPWARAHAAPPDEQIGQVRELIRRIEADLDTLTSEDRA